MNEAVPRIVIWELTQACALACVHCRASARPRRDPRELTTQEGQGLLDQVAAMGRPMMVFSGGDPLMRPDLFELLEHGRRLGLRISVTPAATPRLTREALARMKELGVMRVALSLDGACEATHDAFRRVKGSYARTEQAAAWCRELGLGFQVNATLARRNAHEARALAERAKAWGAVMFTAFFLIPVGRAGADDELDAQECEALFPVLHQASQDLRLPVKTTEAPHYRRWLKQRRQEEASGFGPEGQAPHDAEGIGDGRGFVFVGHLGDVCPSGFLPLPGGNLRREPLAQAYASHPLFQSLRDVDRFKGKCGLCEHRRLCGGSRARAFARTGDPVQSDPACAWLPGALQPRVPAEEALP